MGSLRIEELVLGLGGNLGSLWGLLGFALGSNGQLEAQGGDVEFGGDLGYL